MLFASCRRGAVAEHTVAPKLIAQVMNLSIAQAGILINVKVGENLIDRMAKGTLHCDGLRGEREVQVSGIGKFGVAGSCGCGTIFMWLKSDMLGGRGGEQGNQAKQGETAVLVILVQSIEKREKNLKKDEMELSAKQLFLHVGSDLSRI